MGAKKLLLLCILFVAYLLMGGCVFHFLESEEEERLRQQVFKLQEDVSVKDSSELQYLCTPVGAVNATPPEPSDGVLGVTCCVPPEKLDFVEYMVRKLVKTKLLNLTRRSAENGTCIRLEETPLVTLTGAELDGLIDVVVLAIGRGLDPRSTEENNSPPKWSFSGACSFSVTVVTTIGYGNLAPFTPGGQAFCVAYGVFGIPLTAVLLAKIAQGLGGSAVRVADRIRRARPRWNPRVVVRVVTTCLVTLGLCVFLILPAMTVSLVEGWDYLRSLYFMFVSLSTIGFGDYVAGGQRDVHYSAVYQVVISAWILCGLAFLALVFDLITGGIEKVSGKVESKEPDTDVTTIEEDGKTNRGELFTANICKESRLQPEDVVCSDVVCSMKGGSDEMVRQTSSTVDGKCLTRGEDYVKPKYLV